MLRNKDIKNLSEIKMTFLSEQKRENFFSDMMRILKIGKHHALFSGVKLKGIPVLTLISILLTFPFMAQKNVHQFITGYWNKYAGFGKDAYYRLKNNPKINWRMFLFAVVKRVQSILWDSYEQDKAEKKVKAFIFDDTTIAKRGVFIEGVSKVWDHVLQKSILGYKLLVMGFYDGTMFNPINFSFHRENVNKKKNKYGLKISELKKQFSKKRDKTLPGYGRKKELNQSKISMAVEMIISAVKNGITADYVLTDNWFTCWELVKTTLKYQMHYIGMFSIIKARFLFNNKLYSYKEIRRLNRKKIKRNKRYNLYYIRVVAEWNGQPVVLYFSRKGKNGNWKTLINTNLASNFTETTEIYQLRWSIEVFFKEAKQFLNLGKSESQDFDAQIADTTISMIQYLFLSVRKRIDKYESIGQLYKETKAETLDRKSVV